MMRAIRDNEVSAEAMGKDIANNFPEPVAAVVSPAIGGLIIGHEVARAKGCRAIFTEKDKEGKSILRRNFEIKKGEKLLLVEDVITTGLSTFYRSGSPITAMGYSYWYNWWEYYLSKRGAFGRTDAEWEADLHLGYPIRLGASLQLNLLVDIFDVFNRQGETERWMRYDWNYNGWEDYQSIDWFTGEPNPPIVPINGPRLRSKK